MPHQDTEAAAGEDTLPLYYPNKTLDDMEQMLRKQYLLHSGWLESAERKVAVREGRPLPWFTYPAISFLEGIIDPSLSLFEYGGGQSTLYWADRLASVVSIDHDKAFTAYLHKLLPENARLSLVEEEERIDPGLLARARGYPELSDPPRNEKTFRSGQLNVAFRNYALQLLAWPDAHFDMVVIDGMARVMSTWAAVRHFPRDGFIVFDNADREEYRAAYDLLDDAGYRRIDFWGLGPVNPYEWCTTVFHRTGNGKRWFMPRPCKPTFSISTSPVSSDQPSIQAQPEITDSLGILVLGYNRPYHLQSVLESLRLQGCIEQVHVWIDGTQGRGEYKDVNHLSVTIAERYPVREVCTQRSHLGIEKLMLDALDRMSATYDRVLILEDDCFPLEGAVDAFETALAQIADDPRVYSVYGHHFGVERPDTEIFPRFQGWGWAAWSEKIRALLPELRRLYLMSEVDYVAHIKDSMTDTIRTRLDLTPPRDVLNVLQSFFSWDSATAFLTASKGVGHRPTAVPSVINTGISPGIGHFGTDSPRLRNAPFGMITLDEAWSHWDRTTEPCVAAKDSYGLEELDQRILEALPDDLEPGIFVELGAYDGVTQSNSVLLEARGWKGLLIEPCPGAYARCLRARPRLVVEQALCVGASRQGSHATITDVGLMSLGVGTSLEEEERSQWVQRGEGFADRPAQDVDVPIQTLSGLLEKHGFDRIDLLLLDVEGAEIEVLDGLDFSRHAPVWIVAEDSYGEELHTYLQTRGYSRTKVLLERKYTRDCLYRLDRSGMLAE